MRTSWAIVGVVTIALVLSGCANIVTAPEERVKAALESFPDEMGPGGSIKKLEGSFSSAETSFTADVAIEVSDNRVLVFTISAGIISMKVYCGKTDSVTQIGQEAMEGRSRNELCPDESPGESVFEGELEVTSVEERDDGTLRADVVSTSSKGDRTVLDVTLDPEGRVSRMTIENETATAELEVDYGPRRTISMPQATSRVPADVSFREDFSDGTYSWRATAHNDTVGLDEFEVRVTETDDSGNEVIVATFDPSDPSSQEEAGFTFRFQDDGDGALTMGDSFTVSNDDWTYIWEYDVVVFDRWAEAGLGEFPLPLPGPIWVVAVFLVGAVLWRRRWRHP